MAQMAKMEQFVTLKSTEAEVPGEAYCFQKIRQYRERQ